MNRKMAEAVALAAETSTLKKAVLSKPYADRLLRAVLTLRRVGKQVMIQAETFTADNKARHQNIAIEDAETLARLMEDYRQVNLITTGGECELRRSKSGKTTLLGVEKLMNALRSGQQDRVAVADNNRKKAYILKGDEPFLRYLDVSDEKGRVHDKKQSKFRQINRFLELIRDCISVLPEEGPLCICDLCCGKSHLSFAVYHYFANILGREVHMQGVDLKPDVVEHCNRTARDLHFDGLDFFCMDVAEFQAREPVHMVISLHACDFATDLVLGKALEWRADLILSTPCCHHEMNHMLSCSELDFIARHSMLRQKLCDAATDALRLLHLEAEGYAVEALELIDPEETPKNVMLRAKRKRSFDTSSPAAEALREEYRRVRAFLVGDGREGHF